MRSLLVGEEKIKQLQRDKKGQMLMKVFIGLFVGFMIIAMLIALLPAFTSLIDIGLGTDGLNCPGYIDADNSDGNSSYNSTLGTKSSIGCLGLKLYIPYLVLGILIAVVMMILYDRGTQPQY